MAILALLKADGTDTALQQHLQTCASQPAQTPADTQAAPPAAQMELAHLGMGAVKVRGKLWAYNYKDTTPLQWKAHSWPPSSTALSGQAVQIHLGCSSGGMCISKGLCWLACRCKGKGGGGGGGGGGEGCGEMR